MATITKRATKGSPLTNDEVDANFENLNTDKLETSGGSVTGDISFGDNDKAIFGAGSDLQIYHTGSNSIIDDLGTGNLLIRSDGTAISLQVNSKNSVRAVADEDVELYYNGNEKLATTNTGIDVTGTVTADGLTVDDGTVLIQSDNAGNLSTPTVRFLDTDISQAAGQKAGQVEFYTSDSSPGPAGVYAYVNAQAESTSGLGALYLGTGQSGSAANRLSIGSGGDISFYDTSANQAFYWDASAASLGIGTDSPQSPFDVTNSSSGVYTSANTLTAEQTARLANLNTTANTAATLLFVTAASGGSGISTISSVGTGAGSSALTFGTRLSAGSVSEKMRIDSSGQVGIGTDSPVAITGYQGLTINDSVNGGFIDLQSNGTTAFRFLTNGTVNNIETRTATPIVFLTNTTERMRLNSDGSCRWTPDGTNADMTLDASGNLLVGTTAFPSGTNTGFYVNAGGYIYGSQSGATAAYFNRTTSDGSIVELRKDGSTVGSISCSASGVNFQIYGIGTGIGFYNVGIYPTDGNGDPIDNSRDIGSAADRWKDLYLSGGVYLGGTGAANYLDDYEEGTWTPVDGSGAGLSLTVNDAVYTKVGRVVHCYAQVTYPSTANGADAQIGGLPFANKSGVGANHGAFTVYTTIDGVYWLNTSGGVGSLAHNSSGAGISNAGVSGKQFRLVWSYTQN